MSLRPARVAISAAFFVQGLLFISLTLRLPVVQDLLELSELALSGLMLLLVLLSGVGSVVAGSLARRSDSARALRVALVLIALAFVLVAVGVHGDGRLAVFAAGIAVYGLGLGANDAASNMQAVALEHRARPSGPAVVPRRLDRRWARRHGAGVRAGALPVDGRRPVPRAAPSP